MSGQNHSLKMTSGLSKEVEDTAWGIVDACYQVHTELGPGLLESVYEECLCLALTNKGLSVDRQLVVPIVFQGEEIKTRLRIDLLVNRIVVVEIKAVEKMQPLYQAQLMTYMKLTQTRLGILVNFNVLRIKDGIKRVIV